MRETVIETVEGTEGERRQEETRVRTSSHTSEPREVQRQVRRRGRGRVIPHSKYSKEPFRFDR